MKIIFWVYMLAVAPFFWVGGPKFSGSFISIADFLLLMVSEIAELRDLIERMQQNQEAQQAQTRSQLDQQQRIIEDQQRKSRTSARGLRRSGRSRKPGLIERAEFIAVA